MKSFHEVHISRDFGYHTNQEVIDFIGKNLKEYRGAVVDKHKHGVPLMLFDREQDASRFADDMSKKLNIPREHITVRAER